MQLTDFESGSIGRAWATISRRSGGNLPKPRPRFYLTTIRFAMR